MYITECTLELQGLSSRELAELAGGQSELVTLKLQSDRGLWLGYTILTACYVGQLGNLDHISTFNGKRGTDTSSKTALKSHDILTVNKTVYSASVSQRVKKTQDMQNRGGLIRGTSTAALHNRTRAAPSFTNPEGERKLLQGQSSDDTESLKHIHK